MQALLLATGETQKLRPLTERIPSPMVSILNRPVMLYNLLLLGRTGFKRVLVSVHSRADRIENYFGDGQRWGVSVDYIRQRDTLGSAGALRWAKLVLREQFIVMPADQVADVDISLAIRQHLSQKATVTVVVQPGFRRAGRSLQVEGGKYICAIGDEANGAQPWTDTGIYIFDPSVLECIPPRQLFDIHQNLLPILLAQGFELQTCVLPGYFNPLDTFQDYREAQHMFLTSALQEKAVPEEKVSYRYNWLKSRQIAEGVWTGKNVRVHPSAKILPMVSIARNSWIGEEVELGPNAVIGSNVIIDEGATVKDSIILDGTYVGKLVHLENRLVHQGQLVNLDTGEHVGVTDPVMLGKTDPNFILSSLKQPLEFCVALFLLVLTLPLTLSLGLILLLKTRRVFTHVPYSSPHRKNHSRQPKTFDLLHFNTRAADGQSFGFGTWLESWEGQRLPELLNVVKGDLALVGLKPIPTEEQQRICEAFHLEPAPAGFTGQWYLETDEHSSLEDSLAADAYYLTIPTGTRDWKILRKTPAIWWRKVRSKVKR